MPGNTVTFTIYITNTGDVRLDNVTITDLQATDCARNIGTLAAGAGTSFQCTAASIQSSFTNSATVIGTPTDDAGVPIPVPAPTASDSADVLVGGRIGDFVWWDVNANGIQEAGEPGIPNVPLDLVYATGTVVTTTTDSDGIYAFTHLAPGVYTVTIPSAAFGVGGLLQDWYPTVPSPALITRSLTSGQVITTADFGLNIPTSYTITKHLNSVPPIREFEVISYTIRITNTGKTTITFLPLRDVYDTTYLKYGYLSQFAAPFSADNLNDSVIDWPDLVTSFGSALGPNAGFSVVVTFTAALETSPLPGNVITNTAEAHDAEAEAFGRGYRRLR